MKKILISVIMCFLAVTAPFAGLAGYAFGLPKQYDNTFLAAMSDKYKLLNSIKEPKLVLIGGSNLPFGIDSSLLEKHLNIKVVNFGLYAALGSKNMLDLSKANIRKGDIIVFAAEYSNQLYSMYTNPEVMLQTLDTDLSMIKKIPSDDWFGLFGGLPGFIKQKRDFVKSGLKPAGTGAYSRDSFDGYGDIKYPRPYNIMPDMYISGEAVSIDKGCIDEEFVAYFNKYCGWAKRKKAAVYVSFPPVNSLSLTHESDFEKRLDFYDFVCERFDAEVVSNIEDYIIHEDYFFDSNYHLNDSGKIYRTAKLIGDLKRTFGDISPTDIIIPKAGGALPDEGGDTGPEDPVVSAYFTFETAGNRVVITGLTESGRRQSEIRIPSVIDGKTVYKLADNAFAGCPNLVTLTIPASAAVLGNTLFSGSPKLVRVNLVLSSGLDSPLPEVGDNLLGGANENLRIYVPQSKLGKITTDYFWAKYSGKILPEV